MPTSFTDSRYRDSPAEGARIANSISTVATGGVTIGKPARWFGSARMRYYGPQPLVGDNSVRAPSSITFNASIGWRARDWQATVEVLNVLDRQNNDIVYYFGSRLSHEPASGTDDVHFHPAEPRTLRFSATRRF